MRLFPLNDNSNFESLEVKFDLSNHPVIKCNHAEVCELEEEEELENETLMKLI